MLRSRSLLGEVSLPSGDMISLDNSCGRLCVARFVPPFDVAQVQLLAKNIGQILGRLEGPMIFCCDARQAHVFPPEVSDALTKMMQSDNPRIERNGLIVGSSSVFGLQIERMFRDAGNPGRRVFRTEETLLQWLDEALTPDERKAMRSFLAAGDAG